MNFLVDKEGYYGEFGGAYVPEILHTCVEELQNTYLKVLQSEDFKREYDQLLRDYVGRPSPLYLAPVSYTHLVAVAVPAERPAEYFAKYVFNKEKMFRYLPSKVYAKLTDVIDNGAPLDLSLIHI